MEEKCGQEKKKEAADQINHVVGCSGSSVVYETIFINKGGYYERDEKTSMQIPGRENSERRAEMRKKKEKQPEKQKVVLYRAILHTEGFKVDEKEAAELEYTEGELKVIKEYMAAWDGVKVTVSNLMPGEYSVVGWPPEEDEKVKNAIFLMEHPALGFGIYGNDRERFDADWEAGTWEPSGSIVFSPEMVEILGELGGKKDGEK